MGVVDTVLFELDEVSVVRDGRTLLRSASGSLPDHLVTAVVGPSGSGKSTLLRLCNRLEVAATGSVRYRGRPIEEVDPLALRKEVGMVFQRPTPLPGTVAENLRFGAPDAPDAEVEVMLARVGLEGLAERPAGALSGGQAQRMSLARTLLVAPRFVLFDEPTSALDSRSTTIVEQLVRELADEGVASAWVTHDLTQVRRVAHHVVVVIDGRIVQQGHRDELLAAPEPSVARFLDGAGP